MSRFGAYSVLSLLRLAALLVLAAGLVSAQDCQQTTTLTAAGSTASFQNTNKGCSYWTMVYSAQGFSAVSISFQVADDTGAGPGAFADVAAGSTTTNGYIYGSNPMTATNQDGPLLVRGFYPYLRADLGTATGTGQVKVTLYGWRAPQVGFFALLLAPPGLEYSSAWRGGLGWLNDLSPAGFTVSVRSS